MILFPVCVGRLSPTPNSTESLPLLTSPNNPPALSLPAAGSAEALAAALILITAPGLCARRDTSDDPLFAMTLNLPAIPPASDAAVTDR